MILWAGPSAQGRRPPSTRRMSLSSSWHGAPLGPSLAGACLRAHAFCRHGLRLAASMQGVATQRVWRSRGLHVPQDLRVSVLCVVRMVLVAQRHAGALAAALVDIAKVAREGTRVSLRHLSERLLARRSRIKQQIYADSPSGCRAPSQEAWYRRGDPPSPCREGAGSDVWGAPAIYRSCAGRGNIDLPLACDELCARMQCLSRARRVAVLVPAEAKSPPSRHRKAAPWPAIRPHMQLDRLVGD